MQGMRWQRGVGLILFILLVGTAVPARGEETSWLGGVGSWFDGENWSDGVPTADDRVLLYSGGEARIYDATAVVDRLEMGSPWWTPEDDPWDDVPAASVSSLMLGGHGRLEARWERIGEGAGEARFVQQGGENVVSKLSLGRALAPGYGARGVYELVGPGLVQAEVLELGDLFGGEGYFLQTDGRVEVSWGIHIGDDLSARGLYDQHGGEVVSRQLRLGVEPYGEGVYRQSGGSNVVEEGLHISCRGKSPGRYELLAGNLTAGSEYLGRDLYFGTDSGTGVFVQERGINSTGYLSISDISTYVLSGGSVHLTGGGGLELDGLLDCRGGSSTIEVGDDSIVDLSRGDVLGGENAALSVGANTLTVYAPGSHPADIFAEFSSEGIVHEAGRTLTIQAGEGFAGRGQINDYVVCAGRITGTGDDLLRSGEGIDLTGGLSVFGSQADVDLGIGGLVSIDDSVGGIAGGALHASQVHVGASGNGHFVHSGGTVTLGYESEHQGIGLLKLGDKEGSEGLYEFSGGRLDADDEDIGPDGAGHFVQTGGQNHVGFLNLAIRDEAVGTYLISGGVLDAENVRIARDGQGTLAITNPDCTVEVSETLEFGPAGSLEAAPGSAIHMTGAAFTNKSTDPAALGGLGNLTLIFEGGPEDVDPFEVAGRDMGPVPEGFELNFTLDTLQLGGEDVGRVELLDAFDNQADWTGNEALYVHTLQFMGAGSFLDTNGLAVYYQNGGEAKELFYGDCNLDGEVGAEDLAALAGGWSGSDLPLSAASAGRTWAQGDTNGDGLVDIADLTALAGNWGAGAPAPTSGNVPEPGAMSLLVVGGLFLLPRRRR